MNSKKLKLFISLVTTSVALANILNVDKQISGMEYNINADDHRRYRALIPSEIAIEDILYNENDGLMYGLTYQQRKDLARVFVIVSVSLCTADNEGEFEDPELGETVRANDEQFYALLKNDVTHEMEEKEMFSVPGLNNPMPIERYESIEGRLRQLFTKLHNMGYWEKVKNRETTSEYATHLHWSYQPEDESDEDEEEEELDDEAKEDPFEGLIINDETKSYDYTQTPNLCSICYGKLFNKSKSILNQNPILELVCGHKFHENCLKGWFKQNYTCPNCRLDTRDQNNNHVKRWYVRLRARKA